MKLRLALIVLASFLPLGISADRISDNRHDTWAPSAAHTQSVVDGLGVNIHFTDPQPGEMKMIAAAGFRWVRMDFKWDLTEKEKGRYDFSPYDRLMAALDEHKIRALLILDYGNPLYTVDKAVRTEAARQAFARWAVAAAKHFAGRGVIWEIFNEPNVPIFWPPRPNVDEYIPLALAVGRAFRASVPDERLVGPATSGLDFPFLEKCFKAGLLEYVSAVSVHPYRQSNPEVAANEYAELRKLIAAYTARVVPIISSEWGYSAVWSGMSEQKQGELFPREMLTNAANGIPVSIWYDWQNDGPDPREPEHHFGLVRHPYHAGRDNVYEPKPAYLAARTLTEMFNGYSFERRLVVGSDKDYILLFRKDRDVRIAAWTTSPTAHRIVIPLDTGQIKVTKHTGESGGTVFADQQGLTIQVSTAPVYLKR